MKYKGRGLRQGERHCHREIRYPPSTLDSNAVIERYNGPNSSLKEFLLVSEKIRRRRVG